MHHTRPKRLTFPDEAARAREAKERVRANPAALDLMEHLRERWRFHDADAGLYCNRAEQGYRITHARNPRLTIWWAQHRQTGELVVYVVLGAHREANPFALFSAQRSRELHDNRLRFGADDIDTAAQRIAALMHARPGAAPGAREDYPGISEHLRRR